MAAYNESLVEQFDRTIRPILFNTIKDGSGTWYFPVVDSDGFPLSGHNKTGIGDGVKVVTTAGTDVVLATSTAAKVVTIQAQTDNTGAIAVGAVGVDAVIATGTGIILYAGDSITLEIGDLADVYIDSTVSGEGVRFTYLT